MKLNRLTYTYLRVFWFPRICYSVSCHKKSSTENVVLVINLLRVPCKIKSFTLTIIHREKLSILITSIWHSKSVVKYSQIAKKDFITDICLKKQNRKNAFIIYIYIREAIKNSFNFFRGPLFCMKVSQLCLLKINS